MTSPDFALPLHATPEVSAALEGIGRVEDVRFSPSNRRIALPSYTDNALALVDVCIEANGSAPRISVTDVALLASNRFDLPHGVDFLEEDIVVVASRRGDVTVHRLVGDDRPGRARLQNLDPANDGFAHLNSPGSVVVVPSPGSAELLVCNNRGHTVTRHRVVIDDLGRFAVLTNEVLLRRALQTPDGLTTSRDGALAVSNHAHHVVMVYDGQSLDEASAPTAVLRGVSYPHGLRFTADGSLLFVADAGSPFVHVFSREGEMWRGVRYPVLAVRVMSDETFERGHSSPDEGGPKGIDINRDGRVLVVVSKHQPFAFFDLVAIVDHVGVQEPTDEMYVDYELERIREFESLVVAKDRRLATRLRRFKGFRATEPARRKLYAAWGSVKQRATR